GFLLGLAVVSLLIGFVLVRAEEGRTELARQAAVVNAEEARRALALEGRRRRQLRAALDALTSTMIDDLLAQQPALEDQHPPFVRSAEQLYAEFAADGGQAQATRAAVAESFTRLGQIRRRLAQYRQAETAYRRAVADFEELVADFPEAPDYGRAGS